MSLCHLFPLLCTSKASHFISNFLTGHLELVSALCSPVTQDPMLEFCLMFGLMLYRMLSWNPWSLCFWTCTLWVKNLQGQWRHMSQEEIYGGGYQNKLYACYSQETGSGLCTHAGNIHGQQVVSCAPICLMGVSAESWGQRRVAPQDLGGYMDSGDDGSSCGNIRGWQQGLQESKRMRK